MRKGKDKKGFEGALSPVLVSRNVKSRQENFIKCINGFINQPFDKLRRTIKMAIKIKIPR